MTSTVQKGTEDIVYSCGFYVAEDQAQTNTVKVSATMSANSFSAALPSRKYGTTYYINSFVTNGHELEFKSDVTTFELKTIDEYVTFADVDILNYDKGIRTVEITVEADIWSGVRISEIGVCHGKDKALLSIDGPHTAGSWSAGTSRSAEQGLVTVTLSGFDEATEYYLRPYIKDGDYLSYGEVVSFYIPTIPLVITSEPENVNPTSALLAGEITSDGGSSISERGFVWMEGSGVPTIASAKAIVEGSLGIMTYAAKLSPNQEYTYCAYAINSYGTAYGKTVTFKTPVDLPEVTSAVVSSIASGEAVFSATVTYHGGQTVSEVGFYYSTDKSVDPKSSSKINQAYVSEDFSLKATDLLPNTDYYVKSYAVNSAGVAYGEVKSFATSSSTPSVVTVGATEITSTGALLSGSVLSDNGAAVTERGFLWSLGDGVPTIDSHKLKAGGTEADFSARLDDLQQNQKYSFRAYATNAKGTSYGDIITFSTSADLPSLSSIDVSDITPTSATFASTVTGHGGSVVSEVGFYYSTSLEVNPEVSEKVSRPYAKDAFSLSVSGLQIYKKYYVKAYAINSAGTVFSSVVNFTTLSSTPVVNTTTAFDITPSSAGLKGEVVTDNGASITERGFVWMKGSGEPTEASDKLKVGGTTGEFSATLTGLEPNQMYSFSSYATNANGTSYGEVMSFTTTPDAMTLTTASATSVTDVAASVGGSITYYGGNEVTEVGVCWSTGQTPAVSDSHKAASTVAKDFTVSLTGLTQHTTYYARSYAKAKSGVTYYGDAVSFTTLYTVVTPSASKTTVSSITVSSASLAASVTSDGHGTVTDAGFVYSTSANPTLSSSKKSCGAKTGSFSAQLTGLEEGATYYVRAYVTNEAGTGYGEEVRFTTSTITVPAVSAVTVGTVTFNSAAFTADVIALNNGTLTEVGFVYSKTQNPDLNSTKISCGKTASISGKAASLEATTTYYVRAFATNEKGTAYGPQTSFTTKEAPEQSDIDADDFKPETDWD